MRLWLILLALAVPGLPGAAQPLRSPALSGTNSERRTAAAFDLVRDQGQLALTAFIARMPKGADLHIHLVGAVYAETFLKDAADHQP